jgi:heme a synthase
MITAASYGTHTRAIRLWLCAVAALVLAMVLVGGATRLTESGLSITEWRPVMGVVPPLSEGQWQGALAKYQAIPQYRALNAGMSLADFKVIYWWEWTHRLLGRVIGVAFLLPFIWFLWRGWIPRELRPRLWFIFTLGALQGAVGWWLVASGLSDRIEVSQYRLAAHLTLASIIYVALIWAAAGRASPQTFPARAATRVGALCLLVLVLAQIYLGALVAGLRAGYAYNTWPLIDGALMPRSGDLFFQTPQWRNFFENILTVQFDHRIIAYLIFIGATVHAVEVARSEKARRRIGALALLTAVALQIALGVATLLLVVPLPLALLHQAGAMLVLTVATLHAANVTAQAGYAAAGARGTGGFADALRPTGA